VIRTEEEEGASLINVFGGKLTTSRRLSEEVVDLFGKLIGRMGPRWTRFAKLPGGDFETTKFEAQVNKVQRAYPLLDPDLTRRLTRLYGTRADDLLGDAKEMADLGPHFGSTLYAREVDYLMAEEWARTADDVLWRRTKLGLRVAPQDKERLAAYMAERG
jgi:glycerol-3-phosphate dehydrogenase